MTMTAKFGGKCKSCSGRIFAGDNIDWQKGNGAKHIDCNAKRTVAQPWYVGVPCHGCGELTEAGKDIRIGGNGHRPYCSGNCFHGIGRPMTSQEAYEASADCLSGDSF